MLGIKNNKYSSFYTNKNAITIMALVITIIILLILSGSTLFFIMGQDGLLKKAEISSMEYNKQEATEAINLKITNIQIKSYTETQKLPNLQYLSNMLCEDDDIEYVIKGNKEIASLDKIDVSDVDSIFTKIRKYPYKFEIDSDLRLASIDDVKIEKDDVDISKIIELESRIAILETKVKTLEDEKINSSKLIATPDYEKVSRVSFTNNSYTVTSDGYFQIYFHYTSRIHDSIDSVYINGVEIYRFNTSSEWQNVKTPMLAVKEGDIVSFSNGAQDVQGYYYSIR